MIDKYISPKDASHHLLFFYISIRVFLSKCGWGWGVGGLGWGLFVLPDTGGRGAVRVGGVPLEGLHQVIVYLHITETFNSHHEFVV